MWNFTWISRGHICGEIYKIRNYVAQSEYLAHNFSGTLKFVVSLSGLSAQRTM